jgi:hypothetical protein
MPKRIESPVAHWPGYVMLSDPLTYPQVFAFEDAREAAQNASKEGIQDWRRLQYLWLPGILACVEEWHLEGIENPTQDTFPATPAKSASELLAWLIDGIVELHQEAETIPN